MKADSHSLLHFPLISLFFPRCLEWTQLHSGTLTYCIHSQSSVIAFLKVYDYFSVIILYQELASVLHVSCRNPNSWSPITVFHYSLLQFYTMAYQLYTSTISTFPSFHYISQHSALAHHNSQDVRWLPSAPLSLTTSCSHASSFSVYSVFFLFIPFFVKISCKPTPL